ncbi:MAG: phosphoethanolamine--lipid A transferase [Pseudomonadota bacterium]
MKNYFKDLNVSINTLLIFSSIYIVLFNNFTFWREFNKALNGNNVDNIFTLISFFMLVTTLLYLMLILLSTKNTAKPVIVTFIILSSVISYFIDDLGSVISYSMIQNIIETDSSEALDLLSLSFVLHLIVYGIIPSIIVLLIKLRFTSFKNEAISRLIFISILCIVTTSSVLYSYKEISYVGREHRELRYYINPIYPIVSLYKHLRISSDNNNSTLKVVFDDATLIPKISSNGNHKVLILVVGETARAANFGLNQYQRNTTPLLSKKSIINFNNTSSCGTATAKSLPCMFSDIDKENYEKDNVRYRENLLDALKYAGYDVLWRENNSGCKGVCKRINTQIMRDVVGAELCDSGECFDEALLYDLQNKINNITQDTVIILHQQGSHGPAYYKRVPDEFVKFTPQCSTKDVQNCNIKEVVNSYDNTILYTDFLLSSIINILQDTTAEINSSMIYISDHGESLGEKGIYLHGLPYFMAPKEQTHIPFIVWLSEDTVNTKNLDYNCLKNNQSNLYTHDNLFHSVLGLMDVKTTAYQSELDIFSTCITGYVDDVPKSDNVNTI